MRNSLAWDVRTTGGGMMAERERNPLSCHFEQQLEGEKKEEAVDFKLHPSSAGLV